MGGQRAIAVLVGFKVSRERLRTGYSEQEGSSYSVQDDEQNGYSGRVDWSHDWPEQVDRIKTRSGA